MGQYYIQPQGDLNTFYELSATTDINISHGSSVTSYKVEDGSDKSDNVVVSPRTASLKGIITDVVQAGFRPIKDSDQQSETSNKQYIEDFISGLRSRIDNKELFNVYTTDLVAPLIGCVITSFSISKDNTIGGNAWFVNLELEQIRTASRAQVIVALDADFSALLAAKEKANQNSADADEKQKKRVYMGIGALGEDSFQSYAKRGVL